jgi:hypothetical protein
MATAPSRTGTALPFAATRSVRGLQHRLDDRTALEKGAAVPTVHLRIRRLSELTHYGTVSGQCRRIAALGVFAIYARRRTDLLQVEEHHRIGIGGAAKCLGLRGQMAESAFPLNPKPCRPISQTEKGRVMKRQLLYSLVIASFATLAASAGAQNATPRELPPGTSPANPPANVQNGSPVGTTPSMADTNSQPNKARMNSEQTRAYIDARQACTSQPMAQWDACNDAANKKFSSVDAKCQKLSGPGLADCLHGTDHGG